MMNQNNIQLANVFSRIESKLDSVLTDNFILKNEVYDIKQCIRTDHSTQGNVNYMKNLVVLLTIWSCYAI